MVWAKKKLLNIIKIISDVLRENARNKYNDLSEEEKEVQIAYGRDKYWNMSEKWQVENKRLSEKLNRGKKK